MHLESLHAGLYPHEERLYKSAEKKSVTIAIPKDRFYEERRIPVTPNGIKRLVAEGHNVILEKDAGKAASFPNDMYKECGAKIIDTPEEVYSTGDIIVMVNHPSVCEINKIRHGKLLLSSVVAGEITNETLAAITERKITAMAREFVNNHNFSSPVVNALLPIEGKAAVLMAAELLNNHTGERGVLLGGVAGVKPTEMIIIGAGTTAINIAQVAITLGASVKVFGQSTEALSKMQQKLGESLYTSLLYIESLINAMKTADVVICTIDIKWQNYFYFQIEDRMLRGMKKKGIIIDMAPNTNLHPSFERASQNNPNKQILDEYGIYYYNITNLSSRVAHTASHALNDISVPILLELAKEGTSLDNLLRKEPGLCTGVYAYKGKITNLIMERDYDVKYQNIDMLLAGF